MSWPLTLLVLALTGQTVPARPAPAGPTMPVVVSDAPLQLPADPLRIPPQGAVLLETVIGPTGDVGEVTIVEAPDAVTGRAAADALRRWRFEPSTREGRPVASTGRFTFPLGAGTDGGPVLGVSTDVAFPIGGGTAEPRLVREIRPAYPAALQEKISGNVQLTCVVLPDGTATDIRVRATLEPSLDQAAIDALRKWSFLPGRRAGIAVPVVVEVEFAFRPKL